MMEWTRTEIDDADRLRWLCERPVSVSTQEFSATHTHPLGHDRGCLQLAEVARWETDVWDTLQVRGGLPWFLGDNHRPWAATAEGTSGSAGDLGGTIALGDHAAIVSVGSVGQPRDGDPRACFATVCAGTVEWHRVVYDVAASARRIRANRCLPEIYATRLEQGI